jgi:hypothetical protein
MCSLSLACGRRYKTQGKRENSGSAIDFVGNANNRHDSNVLTGSCFRF